jgi:hypothetical protein
VEGAREPVAEIGDALDRIEGEVGSGRTDLGPLGFWKLVGRVKRDPALVAVTADRIGRIDRAAFEAGVRLRFPVWFGNTVLLAGVVVGIVALYLAHTAPDRSFGLDVAVTVGIACLAAGGVWTVAFHCPAHWVVGRLAGIRCTAYFLGGPFPPRPGLKTDYATYLRTPARTRAWFHASGALATKVAPFLALALSPWALIPWWSVAGLVGVGVLQIVTDAVFSVRTGDWKKFRREMAIARELSGARSG